MNEEQQRGGAFPAPPPPFEQVARHVREADEPEPASFLPEPAGKEKGASARFEMHGFREREQEAPDAGRRALLEDAPSRRLAAVIAGVACLLALVAVIAAVAMAWMGGSSETADDRAIDPRPARITQGSSGEGAQSAEAVQAQEELSAQLAALVADDDGELSAYVGQFMADYDADVDAAVSYGFSDLGISVEELTEKLCDGLSFDIEGIDVYGDKAWVEVSVVSKGFSEQSDVFASKMAESADDFENAEQYKGFMKDALLASFDEVKTRSNTMLVVVGRGEDGWNLSSEDMASLLGAAWYG